MSLKDDVSNALWGSRISNIDFWLSGGSHSSGSLHIDAAGLLRIQAAINDRRIKVTYKSGLGVLAHYYPLRNEIEIGATSVTGLVERAQVVHECVHALCDMIGARRTSVASDEAAAYLAQTIYVNSTRGGVVGALTAATGDPYPGETDVIFQRAWDVVNAHHLHLPGGKGTHLYRTDIDLLRSAVAAHHVYSASAAATTTPSYRGVP